MGPVFWGLSSYLLVPLRFKKEMLSRHKKHSRLDSYVATYISGTLYFSRSHFSNCLHCNTWAKTKVASKMMFQGLITVVGFLPIVTGKIKTLGSSPYIFPLFCHISFVTFHFMELNLWAHPLTSSHYFCNFSFVTFHFSYNV